MIADQPSHWIILTFDPVSRFSVPCYSPRVFGDPLPLILWAIGYGIQSPPKQFAVPETAVYRTDERMMVNCPRMAENPSLFSSQIQSPEV
jgi:hypothetical protein